MKALRKSVFSRCRDTEGYLAETARFVSEASARAETVRAVVDGVCEKYRVSLRELQAAGGTRRLAGIRQELAVRLWRDTGMGPSEIAYWVRRDHSTVRFYLRKSGVPPCWKRKAA